MSAVLDRNAELTALHADIERKSMFPFWATNAGPGHDEVKRLMGAAPKAQAHLWSSFRGAVWAFAHLNGIQTDCLDTGKLKKLATGSGSADPARPDAVELRR